VDLLIASKKRELRALKDKHKGERGFIVCNGPHLNSIAPKLLDNEITIGMNRIYLKPELHIDYLCAYAVRVLRQFWDEIAAVDCKAIFSPMLAKDPKLLPVWMNPKVGKAFSFNIEQQHICTGYGVTWLALHIAWWLGIDPTYIIGLDHEYDISSSHKRSDTVLVTSGDDVNHFHPDYFGDGVDWAYNAGMLDQFAKGFKMARQAYNKTGRTLINASTYTQLPEEVIPRGSLYDIFSQ
jgi:hypothetical protein